MDPLVFLAIGFAPGFFWLWIAVLANRQRPDPLALVIRTFLFGLLAALPILFVESLIGGPRGPALASFQDILVTSFVVAGLVEETGKYLVVRLSLGDSPYLDEPLRGLVYSAAAALGFASIENVGYMLGLGVEVIAPRAILSTLGHVAFSALWGYGLGADRLARAESRPVRGFAILGLVASIAAHGLYDVGAFMGRPEILGATFIATIIICLLLFVRANRTSIHRGRRGTLQLRCPACSALAPLGKAYCAACGGPLPRRADPLCGACQKPVDRRAAFCTHCGAKQDLAD